MPPTKITTWTSLEHSTDSRLCQRPPFSTNFVDHLLDHAFARGKWHLLITPPHLHATALECYSFHSSRTRCARASMRSGRGADAMGMLDACAAQLRACTSSVALLEHRACASAVGAQDDELMQALHAFRVAVMTKLYRIVPRPLRSCCRMVELPTALERLVPEDARA